MRKPAFLLALVALLPASAAAQGPELTKDAIEHVYKTRDKDAIGKLLAIMLERPQYRPRDRMAELILLTLGDKDGDVYEQAKKTLLSIKTDDDWLQIRVARIVARSDGDRALKDFRKLLDNAPSRGLKKAIIHALPYLENEDGIKLLFDFLEGSESDTALDSLTQLMYPEREHTPQITQRSKRRPSVRWAQMQDIAMVRLQKAMTDKAIPGEAGRRARWNGNFIHLVDDANNHLMPQRFIGFQMEGGPRHKTLPAPPTDYAAPEIGFTVDQALRNDIVSGREKLKEAFGQDPLKPSEKAHLDWLRSLYGDADPAPPKAAAVRPPVLSRSAKTNFQGQWQTLADFLKDLDAQKLPPDFSRTPGLEALFPYHMDEFIRRAAAHCKSAELREREYGLYWLEHRFCWTFGMDIDDTQSFLTRKVDELKPLLDRMGQGSLVEARGVLLVHFGVKLEGPPSKKWMPALEKAACSWNPTISFNATRVLCMLAHDSDLMRYANTTLFKRHKELRHHLDTGIMYGAANLGREKNPLPEADAKRYRDALNSSDADTAAGAIRQLAMFPQSTVPFLRKELKIAPEPDSKVCEKLIADLSSTTFKVRQHANDELQRLGEGVTPHLRRALPKASSLEARRRLEDLLNHFAQGRAGMLRSLQVLETLPGPGGRVLLEELANGPEAATLTREAKASLRRVQHYWQW